MKKQNYMRQTVETIFFLVIGLLTACQPTVPTENNNNPNETKPQQTITQEATRTATPFSTNTGTKQTSVAPTSIALPTETTTPTPEVDTPSPTIRATNIPVTTLPTLSPEGATEVLLDLLQNNAGCKLPCWWGAIPGQTQWREVDALLTSMNAEYYEANSQSHEIFLPHVPEELSIEHPRGFRLFYGTQQGIIQDIDVESAPTSNYFLASILSEYGPPEEVLIDTLSGPVEGSLPFRLVMIYWQQGFAVRLFDEAEVVDGIVTACFSANGQQSPSLYLWAVDNYTFSTAELLERSGFAGVGEGEYYLQLEDVTDLDISEFYETYKEPSDDACLQTPADLWNF